MKGKRVLVVTNTVIAPLYLEKAIEALIVGNRNVSVESLILPDGEMYKNMVRFLFIIILKCVFLRIFIM